MRSPALIDFRHSLKLGVNEISYDDRFFTQSLLLVVFGSSHWTQSLLLLNL